MAQIPGEKVEEIRKLAKIEDIISQYEQVEKKGRNYVCICPFHEDHNPSMSISVDKQIFNCFVCGKKGNVFKYIQLKKGVSFPQAVKEVADLINYPLDYDYKENLHITPENKPFYDIIGETIKFAKNELNSSQGNTTREYLEKRGLSSELILKYEIGYLGSTHLLTNFLAKKGYSDKQMVDANLAIVNANGRYEVFKNRLMIPIHDFYGNPIGFTARTMDNDERKYINTSETAVFTKGNVLFNAHRSVEACRSEKYVIVVEGPMDLFAFEKAGYHNVVATMGTACTLTQINLIKKLALKVLVSYDGDKAGKTATYKFLNLVKNKGIEAVVINNDTTLDPDEIVQSYGVDRLKQMINKPLRAIEFIYEYYKSNFDLSNYTDKREFAKSIMNELKSTKDHFDVDYFTNQLMNDTGFSLELCQSFVVRNEPTSNYRVIKTTEDVNGLIRIQKEIISQILVSKTAINYFKDKLGFFPSDIYEELFVSLNEYYRLHDQLVIGELLDWVEKEELKDIIIDISENELFISYYDEKVLQGAIERLLALILDGKIRKVKNELSSTTDLTKFNQLTKEYEELLKQRNERN